MQILLDTNFLLIPAMNQVHIFAEIERLYTNNADICVLQQTVSELEVLSKKTEIAAKDRDAAKLALQLVKKQGINVLIYQENAYADDAIVAYAKEHKNEVIVATQDKHLKTQLESQGTTLLVLRGKTHLEEQKSH